MKKVLSLFLAVLMILSCLSVSAFAAEGTIEDVPPGTPKPTDYNDMSTWFGEPNVAPATKDQTIIQFNLLGGTIKYPQKVFDLNTGKFVDQSNITGVYTMFPTSLEVMKEGHAVLFPSVTPPSGYQFDGWKCIYGLGGCQGQTYGANNPFEIPVGNAGVIMQFAACYSPTEVEEDTMAKVMNILFKVFGTILGILLYGGDSDAGIAVMEKIFGSVFS